MAFDLPANTFLQIAIILSVIRVVGVAARAMGQPPVIGEMIAGVVLGPSLFGLFWPELQRALFPESSRAVLQVLSQLGLVVYMFLVGAEFNLEMFRQRIRGAAAVSAAGIVGPFALSCGLAFYLYDNPALFGAGLSRGEAMLFMGAAMSITAFPVLARILRARGLTGTPLGTLVLSAGALNDAAAWCIFALVLANFSGHAGIAVVAVGGGIAYVGLCRVLGRWVLVPMARASERNGGLSGGMLSFLLSLLMLGAWFTEVVGIHAVFGAFILGTALPRGIVTRDVQNYLGPMAVNFLVPLFFVYSGLHTEFGLVAGTSLWALTALVLLTACIGKGGACWLAARLSGELPRDAMAVGALMNARGLMELILLHIALERGIITPVLFTIMVIMAVGTTLMATPLFNLIYRRQPAAPVAVGTFSVALER
jgi:Kef-type K+ transport system membrane component KefB